MQAVNETVLTGPPQTRLLYGYPRLNRAGLGNLMLPWARCEVFCHRHQVPMLAPQWTQPKVGPVLRREKDKRYYIGLFTSAGYVRGLRRWGLLLRARRVSEYGFDPSLAVETPTLVEFSGLKDFFEPLLAHRDLIRRRVHEILSPRTCAILAAQRDDFAIGVHVRRGDKPPLPAGAPLLNGIPGMPTEWFVGALKSIRRVLGFPAPARVFSDGSAEELRPILSLSNVTLAPHNPAIVDMLMLARSRIVITTANSTFSQWAVYLGAMPSLWYPQGRMRLNADREDYDAESDLAGNVPSAFASVIESLSLKP
jgi:hypothetical protein